ncbi:MAG: hypothetical protein RMK18_10380 [Armatimonadota bacterium]|nr:hypothetical protein [Armatimonadota bacterium]MDW8026251.1 hypothetical protein [Armatimonadota bacterium]
MSAKFIRQEFSLAIYATGFSHWLMVKKMSAKFIRRKSSPPSKDGAQKISHRLWAKAHSMVVKNGYQKHFQQMAFPKI